VAVALAALLTWLTLRATPQLASTPGGLPGPIGGPTVAQDVHTLVGKPGVPFTLSDSEGRAFAVTPGGGKPLVLVFHMGIG
jgi:hypothetical protein